MKTLLPAALVAAFLAAVGVWVFRDTGLTEAELAIAQDISLANLPPLPADPSNRVADNPEAARLGEALFNDTGLSANGTVACATCHQEAAEFQDNLPRGRGIGTTDRRTMPLRGVGYETWLFWDGRKDSLWAQAIGPMESAVEHGFTRSEVAAFVAAQYAPEYEALFGDLPDLGALPAASPLGNADQQAAWAALPESRQDEINRIFANTGKAIAAYERTLMPLENRFDRYVNAIMAGETPQGDAALSARELLGFRVFAGKGQCTKCHNGPRLTDGFFHNTGVASRESPVTDHGRAAAIAEVEADPFNCLGPYSDADPARCGALRFMARDEHLFERAFKAPSLRGVAARPPYMHAGQLATLPLVIEHYNRAMPAASGHTELEPLGLSTSEKAALLAFLNLL